MYLNVSLIMFLEISFSDLLPVLQLDHVYLYPSNTNLFLNQTLWSVQYCFVHILLLEYICSLEPFCSENWMSFPVFLFSSSLKFTLWMWTHNSLNIQTNQHLTYTVGIKYWCCMEVKYCQLWHEHFCYWLGVLFTSFSW